MVERRNRVVIILALCLLSPGRNVSPEADALCGARIYLEATTFITVPVLAIMYNMQLGKCHFAKQK